MRTRKLKSDQDRERQARLDRQNASRREECRARGHHQLDPATEEEQIIGHHVYRLTQCTHCYAWAMKGDTE